MARTTVSELARRYWRLAAIPQFQGRFGLLDAFIDATWPLRKGGEVWINKRRLHELGVVVQLLPLALAREALANGVPVTDILRVWADALDPQ
jgi:hypothetical protein